MIPVARTDQERHEGARLHGESLRSVDQADTAALGKTFRETLPRRAAAQLEPPFYAVAAFRMCVRDFALDLERASHRTAPADCREQRRRRMDANRMRLHVAGNADVLARRIGQ